MVGSLRFAGVFFALVFIAGCGGDVGVDGHFVGGACANNEDCSPDAMCLTKDSFPEGTCSVACMKQEDCPDDARCVEKEGGVCLLQCELPGDCRGGYTCKGVKNQFGGGESLVCIE
jgi:hypothetical protein